MMKKIHILGLTLLFAIASTVSAAADTPSKQINITGPTFTKAAPAATPITVTGTIAEINEFEILITSAKEEKYTIPVIHLKDNETYKKMNLKVGDKIEVSGNKALAAKMLGDVKEIKSLDGSTTGYEPANTLRIHLNQPLSKDAKMTQGTIALNDKVIQFEKALDGKQITLTPAAEGVTIISSKGEAGENISFTISAPAQFELGQAGILEAKPVQITGDNVQLVKIEKDFLIEAKDGAAIALPSVPGKVQIISGTVNTDKNVFISRVGVNLLMPEKITANGLTLVVQK